MAVVSVVMCSFSMIYLRCWTNLAHFRSSVGQLRCSVVAVQPKRARSEISALESPWFEILGNGG